HLAAEKNHFNVVEELLKRGADSWSMNVKCFLPLHFAVNNGNLEIVQLILDDGNDSFIDAQINDGCTALHLAVLKGHFEIVEELLKRGADLNILNNDGNTPLMLAERMHHIEIIKLINNAIHSNNRTAPKNVWF